MSLNKPGILNAVTTLTSAKVANEVVELIAANAVDEITVDFLQANVEGISKTAATNVAAALELHIAIATTPKVREKRPTIAERYEESTTVEERNTVAVQVATLRINEEGTKPISWKNIRGALGLKLDEFHQVVRKSDGWLFAVCARISQLRKADPKWAYNGKLDVLTGIADFDMSMVDAFDARVAEMEAAKEEEPIVVNPPKALPPPADEESGQ